MPQGPLASEKNGRAEVPVSKVCLAIDVAFEKSSSEVQARIKESIEQQADKNSKIDLDGAMAIIMDGWEVCMDPWVFPLSGKGIASSDSMRPNEPALVDSP